MTVVALTSLTHGGGCACKLSSDELAETLSPILSHPAMTHPSLLVGAATSDDAGVWSLSEEAALVQTVDFFTPVVDDPYDWGRIAATNALSDVYAMGGTPITALQLVGWPRENLGSGAVGEVIRGGADVIALAGCVIVGGHSIDSPEPTYGFAVTGLVSPGSVVTNAGARPGDALVLTKPLGVGIITTAVKRGLSSDRLTGAAISVMTALNAPASEAMTSVGVNAATDVTGFGLLGHLREMAMASRVAARITMSSVPVIDGAELLAEQGVFAGGSARNLAAAEQYVDFGALPVARRRLLADAQTSGGLLISVAPDRVDRLLESLHRSGVASARVIGSVVEGDGTIHVDD